MMTFLYVLGVSALGVGLVIFSYLDRIYRELGRVSKGRVHEHLEFFETEIEPHFGLERARATTAFRLLANLWLVLVTAETARGVIVFVPGTWDALVQALVYVLVEVLLFSHVHSRIFAGAHQGAMAHPSGPRHTCISVGCLAVPGCPGACRFARSHVRRAPGGRLDKATGRHRSAGGRRRAGGHSRSGRSANDRASR